MPSRTHPILATVQEGLQKLKACVSSSSGLMSPEMIFGAMATLGALYDSIEEFLHLPSNRQERKWIEEELDGSLRLLDLFGSMRNTLATKKENIQDLQLVLRRKGTTIDTTGIKDIKKTMKEIKSCLKAMKQMDRKCGSCHSNDKVAVLIEAREVTISLLVSIVSLMSSRPQHKASKWSLVSKALQKRKVTCEEENEGFDFSLISIYDCISCKGVDCQRVVKVQDELKVMVNSIEAQKKSTTRMADQHFHARSNSLPSRSNPITATAEEELHKLKACVLASSSAFMSPKMICSSLSSLAAFYDCIEELLHLPSNQQALSHSEEKKWVEEELDASLRLVDLCGIIRNTLAVIKEHAQELQMVLRRKRSMSIERNYIQSAKKARKDIKNCLKTLKKMDGKDSDRPMVSMMFMEARDVTISLFQSLASCVSPSSTQKNSRWSFVSKALNKKKVACEEFEGANGLDFSFNSIYECISCKDVDCLRVIKAQDQLTAIESSLEGLEMELESIYKKLIRNRVSLLNLLSL
ncbi:hypothetical protein J5N97_023817 [Dioscorea zingiberensis]|uniref:Uncharacterized protein n=1 Tax=Dioscorea zingiberensis TaxID=325984 RepID=A0A9D5H890_9LILI|nr:hypothetical protein J5N97_023817 [Dioscorea zingiberensis]